MRMAVICPDVTAPLNPVTGRVQPVLPAGSPDLKPRYVVAATNVPVAGTRLSLLMPFTLALAPPPPRPLPAVRAATPPV